MFMPPGFAKPTGPSEPKAEWEMELEQDAEWLRVRKWREKQLVQGGFSEFSAFRLAMVPALDYRQAVGMLEHGATELQVTDLLID